MDDLRYSPASVEHAGGRRIAQRTSAESGGQMEEPVTRATLLSWAYAALVAAFAAWLTWIAVTEHIPFYQGDELFVLASLEQLSFGERLFTPHGGHILPVTLGLLLADYAWLDGLGHLPVAVSIACTWLASLALWLGLRADERFQGPSSLTCFAFLVYLLFWSAAIHGLFWGFGVANTSTCLFFFSAIACLQRACARLPVEAAGGDNASAARAVRRWVLFASAAGILCTFSFGSGASVWPALLATAWLARLPWGYLAWLVGVGIGVSALYLDLLSGHEATGVLAGIELLPQVSLYAIRLLGAVVGHVLHWLGVPLELKLASAWAGGLGLCAALAATLPWRFREGRPPGGVLLATALVTFAVFAALLAAEARVMVDIAGGTNRRMVMWSAFFWMGLVASLTPHFARLADARSSAVSRLDVGLPLFAMLLSVAMAPAQLAYLDKQRIWARVIEDSVLAVLSGVRSEEIYRRLASFSPVPARVAHDLMAQKGRGPFAAERAGWPGRPIPPELEAAPYSRCVGGVAHLEGLPTEGAPARHVTGTVRDTVLGLPPEAILIVDRTGIVRGLGSVAAARSRDAWRGYVANFEAEEGYDVVAVLSDRKFCSLGPLTSGASD